MPTRSSAYATSLLRHFSTFVDRQNVSADVAQAATRLWQAFLDQKSDLGDWSESEVDFFLAQHPNHPAGSLVTEFVKLQPPFQVSCALDEYLLALSLNGCSKATIKNYRSDIKQFCDFAESNQLDSLISKPKVQAFLAYQLEKGLKPSSITRKLVAMTQFALWAAQEGWLNREVAWLEGATLESLTQDSALPELDEESDEAAVELPKVKQVALKPTDHQSTVTHLSEKVESIQRNLRRNTWQWLMPYFNLALLVLFFLGLGFLSYRQFFVDAPANLAYPSAVVSPNRELSFQGRLTDTAQNPITTATDMDFRLYDTGPGTGGTELWDSGTCSVTPDQDGIFNVGLGDDCGTEISEDVFSENASVWLEVQVAAETLTPRQPIRTVPYALNSETVQGFPVNSTESATINTLLVMNESGQVVLGETNPVLKSVSGTFTIEGRSILLQTTSGSNGNIVLDADGIGGTIIRDYLHAPGATISATYAGGVPLSLLGGPSGTANILSLQDSSGSELAYFSSAGNLAVAQYVGLAADTDLLSLASGALTVNGTITGTGTINSSGGEIQTNGATRISNGGNLENIGTTEFNSITYTWPGSQSTNYVLQTDGSGTLSWVDPANVAGAGTYWTQSDGSLFPKNSTVDFLVGGQATASAKFAVLNINTGTPTATLSANSGDNALYMTGDGTLATTNRQTLTIGNSSTYNTTGDLLIHPNGTGFVGIGTTNPAVSLDVNGDIKVNDGSAANPSIRGSDADFGIYFNGASETGLTGGSAGTNYLAINGANVYTNVPVRVANGSAASPSFSFVDSSTTGIYRPSGNILGISTNGVERMRIDASGNVGIGDTSPASLLSVGSGDLFQVNSSGIIAAIDGVAHTIDDVSGDLTISSNSTNISLNDNVTFAGTTTLNGVAYTWPGADGSSGQVLSTNGSGTLSWTGAATDSSIHWSSANGTIYPKNSTLDFLVGGQATASAKFAVLNMNTGTPTATLAGSTSEAALYMTGEGTIATTLNRSLALNPNGGNVGIGTTSPSSQLSIVSSNNSSTRGLGIYQNSADASAALGEFFKSRGTPGSPATVTSGDYIGAFNFKAYGSSYLRTAGFGARANGTVTGTSVPTDLFFYTSGGTDDADPYGNSHVRMLISSSGNVGIGTTDPITELDIVAPSAQQFRLSNTSSDATLKNGYIQGRHFTNSEEDLLAMLIQSNSTTSTIFIGGGSTVLNTATQLSFYTAANNTTLTGTEAMRINSSQNIGIGTTTISARLHSLSTTEQLRLGYDASNYSSFTVGSTGDLTIAPSGGDTAITGNLSVSGSTITLSTFTNNGGVLYTNGSGVLAQTAVGNSGECLQSIGGGTPTWGSCGSGGSGLWRAANGAYSPLNDTVDILIGSNATASAKFAFLNVNSGTPTASVSAGTNGAAYLTATGNLQTTAQQTLTLGGATTGDVVIQPNSDTGDYFQFTSDATDLTLATTDSSNLTINPAGTLYFQSSSNSLDASGNLILAGDVAVNGDDITSDGTLTLTPTTTLTLNSTGDMSLDSSTDIILDADGADILFKDAATTFATFTNSSTDLTLNIAGGQFLLADTNVFNIGGVSALAYNALANSGGTAGGANVTADNDLYIEGDLEVDGTMYFDGSIDTSLTQGSVVFAGSNGVLSQDNANFFWDDTANALGIGTTTPTTTLEVAGRIEAESTDANLMLRLRNTGSGGRAWVFVSGLAAGVADNDGDLVIRDETAGVNRAVFDSNGNVGIGTTTISARLHSLSTTEQLRLGYDASNYASFTVSSAGNLSLTPTGTLSLNSTGDMTLDSSTDIILDADGADILLKDAGTTFATLTNSSTDLTLDIVGGQLLLADGDVFNIGGVTGQAYNTISDSGTASFASTDDDLYIEDILEVGGTLYVGGQQLTASLWTNTSNVYHPAGAQASVVDLVLGGTSTASAKFAVLNMNTGTPVASISGNSGDIATYLTGLGGLQTTNRQNLSLGGTTTGNINILDRTGSAYVTFDTASSLIGIGTTTPVAKLHTNGAVTGKALAIFNETGDQDILTASASGTTRFRIDTSGYVHAQRFADQANSNYYLDPANSVISMAVASKVGIGTTDPVNMLHVTGAITGKALVNFNETGDQDIFTASASGTNRMVLTNAGFLGLGTSSPSTLLHLQGSSTPTLRITGTTIDDGGIIELGDTDNPNYLTLSGSNDTGAGVFAESSSLNLKTLTNDSIAFTTNTTLRMSINGSGHLVPNVNNTYDLGSSTNRFRELYLGPTSLHLGADGDEGIIGYDTSSNNFDFDPDGDGIAELIIGSAGQLVVGSSSLVTGTNLVIRGDHTDQTSANPTGINNLLTHTTTTTNSFSNTYGALNDIRISPASGTTHTAINIGTYSLMRSNDTGSVTTLEAVRGHAGHLSTGTITAARGVYGIVDAAGGTITNAYGLASFVTINGVGTITNGYGLHISDVEATTDYGIYQAGTDDDNFFGAATNTFSGNIECTNCIDTGDMKTSTAATTGTISTNIAMNDYTFFPNQEINNCNTNPWDILMYNANATDDTVGRFVNSPLVGNCTGGNWRVTWRYVTASRDQEIFAWYDPENNILRHVWASEVQDNNSLPVEFTPDQDIPETWIPVQATIYDESLTTLGQRPDTDNIFRNYTFVEVAKASDILDSHPLKAKKIAERQACLAANNNDESKCFQFITHPDVYYGRLVRDDQAAQRWADVEAEQMAAAAAVVNQTRADLAEYYAGTDDVEPGDIVAIDRNYDNLLVKATQSDDHTLAGIFSTSPGQTLGDPGVGDVKLALAGRVPVKISQASQPVKPGDAITISSEPGKGQKALQPGTIVGRALESWTPGSGQETVMVLVGVSSYDPTLSVNDLGELVIATSSSSMASATPQYSLVDSLGNAVTKLVFASQAKMAELYAGLINVQTLIATSISSPQVETDIISPLGDGDLTIKLSETATDSAKLSITNGADTEVASIDSLGNATFSGQITAQSSRLEQLEARMAEVEAIKAQTAEIVNATVSGTLYAENIDQFEAKVAQSLKQPSLLESLINDTQASVSASLANLFQVVDGAGYATGSGSLNKTLEDLNLGTDDVTLGASALFVNDYFEVNGTAYVADALGVGNQVLIGQGTQIADGMFNYVNPADPDNTVLHIQPSGKGTLSLLAGLMTLDDSGQVFINGDVTIAGNLAVQDTLLTDLLRPTDFVNPLQVQLATASGEVNGAVTESRFEIINELGTPVATISADGRASFNAGLDIGAEDLTTTDTTTDKTSGKAVVKANTQEVIIKAEKVTTESLIYVTPVGSTGNQVLYVKQQVADNPTTPENEAQFVVGFDTALSQDVTFNWWIVN